MSTSAQLRAIANRLADDTALVEDVITLRQLAASLERAVPAQVLGVTRMGVMLRSASPIPGADVLVYPLEVRAAA